MESEYLTLSQVSDVFDVSHSTVSRWFTAGRLVGSRFGTGRTSALMFRVDDVTAFGDALRLLDSAVV